MFQNVQIGHHRRAMLGIVANRAGTDIKLLAQPADRWPDMAFRAVVFKDSLTVRLRQFHVTSAVHRVGGGGGKLERGNGHLDEQ